MAFADRLIDGLVDQMNPRVQMENSLLLQLVDTESKKAKDSLGQTVERLTDKLFQLKQQGWAEDSVPYQAIEKLIKDCTS